jgi:uncharacterized protein (DUF58 family)
MLAKDLLKKIRRIHIRTSHMADDLFAGQYHSAFKGMGMEFEEVREYQPGDDIRRIDWNVTAKQGRPFVKRFREERELTVMVLVDVSGSNEFGSGAQLKRDLAAEVAATLAFSAIKNNDKVGLICFSDQIERYVKPEKGTRHVLRVIREVLTLKPQSQGTNVACALDYLVRVLRRRTVAFVISDFRTPSFEKPMRIARRRHDIIPVAITDPRETALPPVRFIEMVDNETGEYVVVDTTSRGFREAFAAGVSRELEEHRRLLLKMRVQAVELTTGQSFTEPLTKFFRARGARL